MNLWKIKYYIYIYIAHWFLFSIIPLSFKRVSSINLSSSLFFKNKVSLLFFTFQARSSTLLFTLYSATSSNGQHSYLFGQSKQHPVRSRYPLTQHNSYRCSGLARCSPLVKGLDSTCLSEDDGLVLVFDWRFEEVWWQLVLGQLARVLRSRQNS